MNQYVPAINMYIMLTNAVDATVTVWLTSQENLNLEHAQSTSSPGLFPPQNGWGPTQFLREKPWGRGWCSIRIVEDVGRGHFLFLTYLGRSKETQWFDKKKHKVKTPEIRITQIFWPVSWLDSAWNLKVRMQFSSIKKVVSGYLRDIVVIFNSLLTHISKHLKIYI